MQCITGRHLFESIVGQVADALQWEEIPRRCETLAQLTVEMVKMIQYPKRDARWRFVLVLDAIDRQRDAPPTLLPALARLSEIVSYRQLPSAIDRLTQADPMPYLRLHRNIPPRQLPTLALISTPSLPAVREEGIRSNRRSHATEIASHMQPTRNRRSLDPFLRGRVRLSYKVRFSHTAFIQAQL